MRTTGRSPAVDVDGNGNVVANSFTGNGAGLTGIVAATASALAANPANCAGGNSPLGITATGDAESCFDVATQAELNTHKTSTDHDARYDLLGHNGYYSGMHHLEAPDRWLFDAAASDDSTAAAEVELP